MKISIITPVYNRVTFIRDCIESVINQDYDNIEFIVIDGKSNDGTLKVINKYVSKIDILISESDKSMYHAINKGIKLATGDVIGTLNSDDQLSSPDIISKIARLFLDKKVNGIYGNMNIVENDIKKQRKVFQINHKDLVNFGKGTILPFPTVYIRSQVYKTNLFNLDYKYASDIEFLLRVTKSINLKHFDEFIVDFYRHDGTITSSGSLLSERKQIFSKYNSSFMGKIYLYILYFFKNKLLL